MVWNLGLLGSATRLTFIVVVLTILMICWIRGTVPFPRIYLPRVSVISMLTLAGTRMSYTVISITLRALMRLSISITMFLVIMTILGGSEAW